MSTEMKKIGIDPQEEADRDAVFRHAFEGAPLDAEVAQRIHERAARVTEQIRRVHGDLNDTTIDQLFDNT